MKPKADGSPLLAGLIAAILLAILWLLLVWLTHNPVSVAAWGVGGLIGVTLAKSAGKPDASLGIPAVGLTVGAVFFAKVLILVVALPQMVRDEILRNRELTTVMFMVDMGVHRSFSPDLQAGLDTQSHFGPDSLPNLAGELGERMIKEAGARVAAATPAQRNEVIRVHIDRALARAGSATLLERLIGFWDLLWLGLGVTTAWQLARAGWVV
jgi:phosphate/sulfate permease